MNILEKINQQKQKIQEHELSSDSYYLSLQYKEDYRKLHELEKRYKQQAPLNYIER